MILKTVFVKIGHAIVEAVEYPFKHAAHLAAILNKGVKDAEIAVADAPDAKQLIVGLVEQFEKLGPDVVADIASKGFNFAADAQTVEDVKAAFEYFQTTFLPGVEQIYQGLFGDPASPAPSLPAPAPGAPAAPVAEPQAATAHVVTQTIG